MAPGVRGEMGILWFPAMRNRRRVVLGPACEVHGVEAITERARERETDRGTKVCSSLGDVVVECTYRRVRSVQSLPVYNCGRCLYVFVWVCFINCRFKLSYQSILPTAVSLLVG